MPILLLGTGRMWVLFNHIGKHIIGKRAHLPDQLTVGRNCKIGADLRLEDFSTDLLASGETVEDRTFTHGWEREIARRRSATS